jgi:hypothetical protein
MCRSIALLTLMTALALGAVGIQPTSAQQQSIKRTDLLKSDLAEIKDNEMHVWVADLAPGAATGRHSHPTPRLGATNSAVSLFCRIPSLPPTAS